MAAAAGLQTTGDRRSPVRMKAKAAAAMVMARRTNYGHTAGRPTPRGAAPARAPVCIDNRRQCGSFLIYGLLCCLCGSVTVGHPIALAAIYVSAVSQNSCYLFYWDRKDCL